LGARVKGKAVAAVERDRSRLPSPPVKPAPSVNAYWTRSLFGSAVVLFAAALLTVALVAKRESTRDLQHLAGAVRLLANEIASDLSGARHLLESAGVDGVLQDALGSPRPEVRHRAELGLQGRLPDALDVRLLPAEQVVSVDGVPAMSYAGLDLARQATKARQVTPVEAHKVGQPDMHLAIAGPVFDLQGDRVLGVVYLALPMSLLPNPDSLLEGLGVAMYRQVVGGRPVPLDSAAPRPEAPPDQQVEIPKTRLQIAAWRSHGGLDLQLLGAAGAVYLITLGVIGFLLWLGHRRLRRGLLEDVQGLILMVQDALKRRPIRSPQSQLAETQRAHLNLLTQLRALGPVPVSQGLRKGAKGKPRAASSTSLTSTPGSTPPRAEPGWESSEWQDLDDSSGLDALDELELPDPFTGAEPPPSRPKTTRSSPDQASSESVPTSPLQLPKTIFRAYDIRGLVDEQLTPEALQAIGWSLGSAAVAAGDWAVLIGRDCRPSSPALSAALAAGVRSAGPEVVDLGVVPSPLVYFACCHPEPHAGAVVTGSHNPSGYNGVKPILAGHSLTADEIQGLRRRIETGDLATGSGGYRQRDPLPEYRAYIERDVALARELRVVVDCGNATASTVAPTLYRTLGCEVIERNCDLGAGMDDQVPDPSVPEYLAPLGERVVEEDADIGLAFDGDGDRLGVVDSRGRFIPADRVLMLLAGDVLSRNPGTDVIFDVKCSGHLAKEIRTAGGRPVMWCSGHAPLKAKLREGGALIAGELSGHIIFQERWFGFDDAVYAGARLLEVLSLDPRTSQEIFESLPSGIVTPELAVPLEEGEPARVMDRVVRHAGELEGAELIFIDGVRAEFENGWGLVRASNTQPKLTFRFEGEDQAALAAIQSSFRSLMHRAAPGLALPF